MHIPKHYELMNPIIKNLNSHQNCEFTIQELSHIIFNHFALSYETLHNNNVSQYEIEKIQKTVKYRLGWALTYLYKAGLIERPKRSIYQITIEGVAEASIMPNPITVHYLKKYPAFMDFITPKESTESTKNVILTNDTISDKNNDTIITPDEAIKIAYEQSRSKLENELSYIVTNAHRTNSNIIYKIVFDIFYHLFHHTTPTRTNLYATLFEQFRTKHYIALDPLGINNIYVHINDTKEKITQKDITHFNKTLHMQAMPFHYGAFITIGTIEQNIRSDAKNKNITIIDKDQLVSYMIHCNIGTTITTTYHMQDIDENYFTIDNE